MGGCGSTRLNSAQLGANIGLNLAQTRAAGGVAPNRCVLRGDNQVASRAVGARFQTPIAQADFLPEQAISMFTNRVKNR